MKLAIKAMSVGNKQQMEDVKMMFLSKKTKLVKIINSLKSRINNINNEVNKEIKVRDTLLHQEQSMTRRLRSEIVKAKDVLMSNDMALKARNVFKTLVDLTDEEKVFLENGQINELLEKERLHRQTFEYVRESDNQ